MAFIYFLLFIGLLAIWALNESRKQRSHDAKQEKHRSLVAGVCFSDTTVLANAACLKNRRMRRFCI